MLAKHVQAIRISHHLFNRFRNLPAHQQSWIGVLVAGFILILVFTLCLKPAWDFGFRARRQFASEAALLDWVKENAEWVHQQEEKNPDKPGDNVSLLALASSTASNHQISFLRYEPGTEGKLSLWLSDADFNALLGWLDTIVREHGVRIDRLNITQSKSPGKVEAQITLQR